MPLIDLTGQRYGRLMVDSRANNDKQNRARWLCICDCGNKKIVSAYHLKNGHTTSCGCYQKEVVSVAKRKSNSFIVGGKVATVYTSNNEAFLVDSEDLERVLKICWVIDERGYCHGRDSQTGKYILLHRYIMRATNGASVVDHINGNKRDNRKSNLRLCSRAQNNMNRNENNQYSSGRVGVCWCKNKNKWRAYIKVETQSIHLGYFSNKEDAIQARMNGEDKYFGDYSVHNSQGASRVTGGIVCEGVDCL